MNNILEILDEGIKQLKSDKEFAEWSRDNALKENEELKAKIAELENRENDTF